MLEIIMAGFGGQGVMSMGQLITYSGMIEDKEVSWMPSYGPEMRGGTANCTVVVSENPIGSPVVTEPDVVIAMNLPSLDKFESQVKPGGVLIVNSSLIERKCERDDITVLEVPANDIANDLGSGKVANMVVLGSLIAQTNVVTKESVIGALKKVLPEHRHNLIPLNEQAIDKGSEFAK
ncbi:2-oxoacid:acceptor oxidoreductase family protein [Proteinivorax hydrogeniformans]|uniref:2-oxoacid:acceptor oxidoreductase family protein n=1 Tax=Proteinivorax hydrogeniformans TaxID=1826727 RepID=A0AAU8HRK6_9FIRM